MARPTYRSRSRRTPRSRHLRRRSCWTETICRRSTARIAANWSVSGRSSTPSDRELTAEAEVAMAGLRAEVERLDTLIADANRRTSELKQEPTTAELKQRLAAVTAELEAAYGSSSWQLTRPLRGAKREVGRAVWRLRTIVRLRPAAGARRTTSRAGALHAIDVPGRPEPSHAAGRGPVPGRAFRRADRARGAPLDRARGRRSSARPPHLSAARVRPSPDVRDAVRCPARRCRLGACADLLELGARRGG